MRKMTIGVRGRGVLISHLAPDNARLITTRAARKYARLLLEAAEEAERTDPLEVDEAAARAAALELVGEKPPTAENS